MRVLHYPINTAGGPYIISRAERNLGLKSEVMIFEQNCLRYPTDYNLGLEKKHLIKSAAKLSVFLMKAFAKYDVFHCHTGMTLMPVSGLGINSSTLDLPELPIMKILGKKLVVTYHGCCIRQKNLWIKKFKIEPCSVCDIDCNEELNELKLRRLEKFHKYALKIFATTPDLMHILPKEAMLMPVVPIEFDKWNPIKYKPNCKFTILHSPTCRATKGTSFIIKAIENLKKRYSNIELLLVENIPHSQVREIYARADLVVDQLYAGWYGAFAIETMALMKPVVCYIRDEDLQFVPEPMRKELPIINANTENIESVIENQYQNRELLPMIGEMGRSYIEHWHNPQRTAMMLKEIYES